MSSVDRDQRESFEALIRPHLERLYRLAYRLAGARAEAEDLFQDVLVKAFTRLDDLAEDLGCVRRTVYRDLDALMYAGFPVTSEKRDGKAVCGSR